MLQTTKLKTAIVVASSLLLYPVGSTQGQESWPVAPPERVTYESDRPAEGLQYPLASSSTCSYNMRVAVHIIRTSDGATQAITLNDLDTAFYYLNQLGAQAGLSFWISHINYIDDDRYWDNDWNESAHLRNTNVFGASVNTYFVPVVSGLNFSVSSYPSGDVQGIILLAPAAYDSSTWIHEMGHYFDLRHTHYKFWGIECPDGGNCSEAGDRFCDTPADPMLAGRNHVGAGPDCVYDDYASTPDDCSGTYAPLTDNIMSYSRFACRVVFTPEQINKMCDVIANDRPELDWVPGNAPDFWIRDCDDLADDGSLPIPCANGTWWAAGDAVVQNMDATAAQKVAPGMHNRLRQEVRNRGQDGQEENDIGCTVYAYWQPGAAGLKWPPKPGLDGGIIVHEFGTAQHPDLSHLDEDYIWHPVTSTGSRFFTWFWYVEDASVYDADHLCVGFMIHPTIEGVFPIDPTVGYRDAKGHNNVAQTNVQELNKKAEGSKSGADSTVFHTRLRAYNSTGVNTAIGVNVDQSMLPIGWYASWFPNTPQPLPPDSFFPVDINIIVIAGGAAHGDSGLVEFTAIDTQNPENDLGGVRIIAKIDNHSPDPILDLDLFCPSGELACCLPALNPICNGLDGIDGLSGLDEVAILEWSVPTLDTAGTTEEPWFFYVARATVPPVDTGDIFDSVAADLDLSVSKFQYIATAVSASCGFPYDYAVFTVDKAHNVSGPSNTIQVTIPCAGVPCIGIRGNVNGDPSEEINIGDLTYYIDYLFRGGPPPPSLLEADVNRDGSVNIADLTDIVAYLFLGGEAPETCGFEG